jgi:hypothetical protein
MYLVCYSRILVITLYSGHIFVYYASMLRCWHLVWILVRTDHPCLGVGCHTRILNINMTRKYTLLKYLSSMYYGRELSHVCGYAWELGMTFYGKEILHFWRYWKIILFLRLWVIPILVDYETSCIRKTISLSFHAHNERPNQRLYTSCAWIWL